MFGTKLVCINEFFYCSFCKGQQPFSYLILFWFSGTILIIFTLWTLLTKGQALWSFCPQIITLSLTHWSHYTCFSPCQRNSKWPVQPAGSYLWLLCIKLNHVHLNNYIKNIFYTTAISIKICKEFIILFLSWLLKSAICQYYEHFKRWDFTCKENQWHIITWVMMWQNTN